eukprot:8541792-Lingulodinium_polyedra.AAC.1
MIEHLPLPVKLAVNDMIRARAKEGLVFWPEAWRDILSRGIPKESSPRVLEKWRRIALTACVQKVFLRPAMALVAECRFASK